MSVYRKKNCKHNVKRITSLEINFMSMTNLMHTPIRTLTACNIKVHILAKYCHLNVQIVLIYSIYKTDKSMPFSALPTTVTLNEHLATFPELSEALHETVVVPNTNDQLSGWEQVRRGRLSTLSHTAGMKVTFEAVGAPTSVINSASEQFRVGAWLSALK